MARKQRDEAEATQPKEFKTPKVKTPELSPEWIEENADALMEALAKQGALKLYDEDKFDAAVQEEAEKRIRAPDKEKAAAEALGLNLDEIAAEVDDTRYQETLSLIASHVRHISSLMGGPKWRSVISRKKRQMLYGILVFARQVLNIPAPSGQAKTVKDLMGHSARLDEGPMARRGQPRVRLDPSVITEADLDLGD